jgi:hypothetical protein
VRCLGEQVKALEGWAAELAAVEEDDQPKRAFSDGAPKHVKCFKP